MTTEQIQQDLRKYILQREHCDGIVTYLTGLLRSVTQKEPIAPKPEMSPPAVEQEEKIEGTHDAE